MKTLYTYLIEDGEMATPSNTMGMGNPQAPGPDGEIGSEPIEPTAKVKKQKRKKVKESLLNDIDELTDNDDAAMIEQLLRDNFRIKGDINVKSNKEIDVDGSVVVTNKKIEDLTFGGLFKFGRITSYFECNGCKKLKSLKGAPYQAFRFDCIFCNSLVSLEGAPQKVDLDFDCSNCAGLTSLSGAPEYVGRDFMCPSCSKLTSLEGSPKHVEERFGCWGNPKLKTLDGVSEFVGTHVDARGISGLKIDYIPTNVKQVICDRGTRVNSRYENKIDYV